MITPVTEEEEWLRQLNPQPTWTPPDSPVLVVAPHPDDETLGAGGLIASRISLGSKVVVAAVTDGEKAYPDDPQLSEIRVVEQEKALNHLGVPSDNILRFRLPDSNLAAHESQLAEQLAAVVSKDMHVIAPWVGDFHPDHEACGRAAAQVAQSVGATLSWYFFWTWHWGKPASLNGLALRRFVLSPDLLQSKVEALSFHRSQLTRPDGEPILPERLLAPAYRPFEIFAVA